MTKHKNRIKISLFVGGLFTSFLVANPNSSELDALAEKVAEITQTEREHFQEPLERPSPKPLEEKHLQNHTAPLSIETPQKTPRQQKSLSAVSKKVHEVLQALGQLAEEEGTDSACRFCSAILKDVTVNNVEVVKMGQDWIALRIKKGDTLSAFAERYYGDEDAYKRLLNINRDTIRESDHIYIGETLTIPRMEPLELKQKRENISCKFCQALLKDNALKNIDILTVEKDWIEVKIKHGETLSNLALKYYGDPSLYSIIYNANRDKISRDDMIYVGDILRIPKRENPTQ